MIHPAAWKATQNGREPTGFRSLESVRKSTFAIGNVTIAIHTPIVLSENTRKKPMSAAIRKTTDINHPIENRLVLDDVIRLVLQWRLWGAVASKPRPTLQESTIRSRKQPRDRLSLDQLARLVEVVVDD